MFIEIVFFLLAMCPWWFACWLRDKTVVYWGIYLWVCVLMLVYYSVVHHAPLGILNNAIEIGIGIYGLRRISRRKICQTHPHDGTT